MMNWWAMVYKHPSFEHRTIQEYPCVDCRLRDVGPGCSCDACRAGASVLCHRWRMRNGLHASGLLYWPLRHGVSNR
ncbi:hypothetical protein B0J17DRAFT_666970 [Rhizoctonia solani]|nr:hypothetical protein B0J17DRAFT_666970 [Rhizoctonia solani]